MKRQLIFLRLAFIFFLVLSISNPVNLFSQAVWNIANQNLNLSATAFVGNSLNVNCGLFSNTGKQGEIRGYAYARKTNNVFWCPLSATGYSNVLVQGIGSNTLRIEWYATSLARYRCESNDPYCAYALSSLLTDIGLVVGNVSSGIDVTVNSEYSCFSFNSFKPESVTDDTVTVSNTSLFLNKNPLFTINSFDVDCNRLWKSTRNQTNQFTITAGDTLEVAISADTKAVIHDPGELINYMIRDREQGAFWGELIITLETLPYHPVADNSLLYFSLDIGSDTELSDPFQDGDEVFDPGDVYSESATVLAAGGEDGYWDDAVPFGSDPYPDPPDSFPPLTAAPVNSSIDPNSIISLYHDLDGFDRLDMSLLSLVYGPHNPSVPFQQTKTVYTVRQLLISFDDDQAEHYAGDPWSCTVPVMSQWCFGTTVNQDEVMGLIYSSPPSGPGHVTALYPYMTETDLHASLAPNPDNNEAEKNDDVDALDRQYANISYLYSYFSVDHEAAFKDLLQQRLDPGAVYQTHSTGFTKVVDPVVHLGLQDSTDIDAFEFTWIPDLKDNDGRLGLALLFSVDDDDMLTKCDESGGLNPNMLYYSFMNGAYDSLLAYPLPFDVDAITAEWSLPISSSGTGIEENPQPVKPSSFLLKQNQPNPFNPQTALKFQVVKPGMVSIKVFDMQGRLINTLVNGYFNPGSYSEIWFGKDTSGRSVPSGIYLFRMITAEQTEVRKGMLIK